MQWFGLVRFGFAMSRPKPEPNIFGFDLVSLFQFRFLFYSIFYGLVQLGTVWSFGFRVRHNTPNYPWKETSCPNGCKWARKLSTFHKLYSYGKKFLKCIQCRNFQWLLDVIPNYRRGNLRVKLEVSLDDLCKVFDTKFNYKEWM